MDEFNGMPSNAKKNLLARLEKTKANTKNLQDMAARYNMSTTPGLRDFLDELTSDLEKLYADVERSSTSDRDS